MLDDDFMDGLLDRALHFAGRPGLVEFKGDCVVGAIKEEYGLDKNSAEAALDGWLTSRGGGLERRNYDFGPPMGSKIRTAASTGYDLVAVLPGAAVPAASPRAAAKLWPE